MELVAERENNSRFPEAVDPGAIIRRHGLEHGLLLYARRQNAGRFGDWMVLAPPLVIDEATCDEIVDRFGATIASAEGEILAALADC